jgi:hypothetical protein
MRALSANWCGLLLVVSNSGAAKGAGTGAGPTTATEPPTGEACSSCVLEATVVSHGPR